MTIRVGCARQYRLRVLLQALMIFAVSLPHYRSVESAPINVTPSRARKCKVDRSIDRCCLNNNPKGLPKKAIPYVPPATTTVLPRQSIQTAFKDPAYLAKYQRAYALLRSSGMWDDQVNCHCAYSDRNSLGVNVHGNSLFFPWHRWYLFFHERMLQRLINDTSFRLPFWQWDDTNIASKQIPAPYRVAASSLYDPRRNGVPSNIPIVINDGTTTAQMVTAMVDSPGTEEFFGSDLPLGGGGSVEQSVHGIVHVAVGQQDPEQSPPFTDMGSLAAASNDALFYVHHNNVDRMWWLWKRLPPGSDGQPRTEPTTADWLNTRFLFLDELGQLRSVFVRDSISTARLGYTFEEVRNRWLPPTITLSSPGRKLLSDPADISIHDSGFEVDPADEDLPALQRDRRHLLQTNLVPETLGPQTLDFTATTVTLAQVPLQERNPPAEFRPPTFNSPPQSPSPTPPSSQPRPSRSPGRANSEVFILDGFQLFNDIPVIVNVFLNNPKASLNTACSFKQQYCGSFVNVPTGRTLPGGEAPPKRIQISLSNCIDRAGDKGESALNVTLVPYTLNPNTGARTFLSGEVATVKRMSLEFR